MAEVEWMPIPGHDGYEASSDGRVRSWRPLGGDPSVRRPPDAPRPLQIRNHNGGSGHLCTYLSGENGKTVGILVHRAVLLAFRGRPANGLEARHLDGNPTNNALSNLAWGSPRENAADKFRHGTQPLGSDAYQSKLSEDDIPEILRRLCANEAHGSIAKDYGVSRQAITDINLARKWRHMKEVQEHAHRRYGR